MDSPLYAALPDRLWRRLDPLPLADRIAWVAAIFGGARPGESPPLRWPEGLRDDIGSAR